MNLCNVNDELINYLFKTFGNDFYYNKSEHHQRPYIIPVLSTEKFKYIAPVTSRELLKEGEEQTFLQFENPRDGGINFAKMIPIFNKDTLKEINPKNYRFDKPYQERLARQLGFINENAVLIKQWALAAYRLSLSNEKHAGLFLYNYKKLEKAVANFKPDHVCKQKYHSLPKHFLAQRGAPRFGLSHH